jgi:hypothetical protein
MVIKQHTKNKLVERAKVGHGSTISNYMHYSLNGEIETVLIYRCPLIDSDLLYTGGPSRQV